MNKNKYFSPRSLCASLGGMLLVASCVLNSCAKDESDYQQPLHKAKEEIRTHNFELISVKSHTPGGAKLQLSLNLDVAETFRAFALSEREDTGELNAIRVGEREQMHIFVRKQGDDASLTMATLTWEGRGVKEISLPKLQVELPQGYTIRPGEPWYIMGILGGELDKQNKVVRFGGDSQTISIDDPQVLEIPYSFAWKPLTIEAENQAGIGTTTMQARGTILRLHFYSDLIDDYQLKGLTLNTNAWRAKGSFSPLSVANTADQANQKAAWQSEASSETDPNHWGYELNARSINIGKGSKHSPERTLFVWAMPTELQGNTGQSSIQLRLQRSGSTDAPIELLTYDNKAHRAMKEGASYRLSNVLTTTLMISEVYYQHIPQSKHNYSIVELYNPTMSDIDLSDYALVRTAYHNGKYGYASAGKLYPDNQDLRQAGFVPLGAIMGNTHNNSKFPQNNYLDYRGQWHKTIYGTPSLTLAPGKTILIGAGGYIQTNNKPGQNILAFNEASYSGGSTRNLEQANLPQAGQQADSAFRLGYVQSMVAIDNGGNKGREPNPSGRAGVLQLGNNQGIALVKYHIQPEGGLSYPIVDITSPIGNNAEANRAFQQKFPSQDWNQAVSYSLVRRPGALASSTYKPEEWERAESENDGVKSIGTRNYVAGLTPFKPNYTGYNAENNPKGNPFWSAAQALGTNNRAWNRAPGSSGDGNRGIENGFSAGPIVRIPVQSGTATEQQSAYPIESSFDNDYNTFYHSKNRGDRPNFPITLTYNLGTPQTLSHIMYVPRDKNGSIDRYSIRVTYGDNTSRTINMQALGSPTTTTRITWQGIETKPIKEVAFIVQNTHYGVLAVKEMEFYTPNKDYIDPNSIFQDITCTQLRPEMTYERIMAIENPFYREMARKMLQGTYEREFRIDDFKPYLDPWIEAQRLKTMPHSRLENPTGIAVEQGEKLIVFVGDTHGHSGLALRVQNLDKPGQDGFGGTTYPINRGINELEIKEKGLVYVEYQVNEDRLRTARPIRIHFATGTVNGYFDSQRPSHRGRWRELLSKAKNRYFDLVGQYAHMTFETNSFRLNTPEGLDLINLADLMVKNEMEHLGLYKYNRVRRNRDYMHVMYKAFMYATNNHTAYNHSLTANTLTSATNLRNGYWGPAHELGHTNQTHGLKWIGMTECTVNIFSFHIGYNVLKSRTRMHPENEDRYRQAWNALMRKNFKVNNGSVQIAETKSHSEGKSGDAGVIERLTPFIQLEMYFGDVLGRTPTKQADKGGFYPDVYEYLRTHDSGDDGHQQSEFAYIASKISGYDLTDFFSKWGFLTPIDHMVGDYANRRLQVTTQRAAEVRNKIKQANLLRLPVALEYITEVNVDLFRNPRAVVMGTARKDGNKLKLSGFQYAVGYEVVNAQGEIEHIDYGHVTQLNTTKSSAFEWNDSYKLYVVAANGDRTLVTVQP